MSAELDDDCLSEKRDPVDARSADFDWDAVFERLDSGDGIDAANEEQTEIIARLMRLLLADAQAGKINPKTVGLRVLALAWVLNPAHYPDAPSLRRLAERCGVSPALLAFYTGEVSRLTGIRNRALHLKRRDSANPTNGFIQRPRRFGQRLLIRPRHSRHD